AEGARELFHAWRTLPAVRPVQHKHSPARRDGTHAADFPAGVRPAWPRPMVAHHVRHADIDDGGPRRRHVERDLRRRVGWYFRLFWRLHRSGDPAADRTVAVCSHYPDLAGACRGAAARLD